MGTTQLIMIETIKKHKIEILGLTVILLLASFFYFYHITQRGFFEYDEAFLLLTGNSFAQVPKIGIDYLLGKGTIQDLTAKYLPGTVLFQTSNRPIFVFLETIGILVFGYHDYSAFIMNGIISLGSIIVLYFVAKRVTGDYHRALFITFLFGISGYQIYAARGAFSVLLAGFFALCGSLFYIRNLDNRIYEKSLDTKRNLILAGFFWGLMFLSHYSTLFFLASVGIFEILMFWLPVKKSWPIFFKRLAFLVIPFFSVIFFIQIILLVRSYFLIKAGYPHLVHAYFYEIWQFFKGDMIGDMYNIKPQDFFFYGRMVNALNGLLYLILFLIGPIIFFWKKWWQNLPLSFVFLIAIGVFLFASINGFAVPRAMTQLNGFISLIVALVFLEIFYFLKVNNRNFAYLLLLTLLIFQIQINWGIINLKSGYKEAAEFLSDKNVPSKDIYTESWPIFSFYLNKKVQIFGDNPQTIYYVAEYHEDGSFNSFDFDIADQGELMATFDNPMAKSLVTKEEIGFPEIPPKWPAVEQDKIKIYKVDR